MPRYRIEALERFLVQTTYFVDATGPLEAEQNCRDGKEPYELQQLTEGDDEWIETLSVALEEPL